MICVMIGRAAGAAETSLHPFHVHPGHEFEGLQIVRRRGQTMVLAVCGCGAVLDIAEAAFSPCPVCGGAGESCARCGGSGEVIDHAALRWRLPYKREEWHADDA